MPLPSSQRAHAMIHTVATLEGIARDLHDSTGGLLPVDAFRLAQRCGFVLRPWAKGRAELHRHTSTIWYPAKARHSRQHGTIAHELGHYGLWRAGLEDCEESARYLAGAIMLPRSAILADLQRMGLDLFALMTVHPNASGEMIAARMTQVLPATAWVWDCGRLTRQYGLPAPLPANAVQAALDCEEPVEVDGVVAWPLLDEQHRRVIAVRRTG